jgi:hypothetical protein
MGPYQGEALSMLVNIFCNLTFYRQSATNVTMAKVGDRDRRCEGLTCDTLTLRRSGVRK